MKPHKKSKPRKPRTLVWVNETTYNYCDEFNGTFVCLWKDEEMGVELYTLPQIRRLHTWLGKYIEWRKWEDGK